VHTRDLPKLFVRAVLGRAKQAQDLVELPGGEFWIESADHRDLTVACDGELATLKAPLHYRSWPRALNVLTTAGSR
jgi:diacylglycerol kinase family enzyme